MPTRSFMLEDAMLRSSVPRLSESQDLRIAKCLSELSKVRPELLADADRGSVSSSTSPLPLWAVVPIWRLQELQLQAAGRGEGRRHSQLGGSDSEEATLRRYMQDLKDLQKLRAAQQALEQAMEEARATVNRGREVQAGMGQTFSNSSDMSGEIAVAQSPREEQGRPPLHTVDRDAATAAGPAAGERARRCHPEGHG